MSALITPEQMAERFSGVEVKTVLEWNRKYHWPHVRVGKQLRWTEEQYDEIVRQHSAAGDRPKGLPGQTARSASRKAAS
jgi:hypothetical protein